MKRIIPIIICFTLPPELPADSDNDIFLGASVSHDSNLNKSPSEQTELSSHFYTIESEFRHSQKIDLTRFTNYSVELDYEKYDEFENLDNLKGSAGISYHYKPEKGFTSATYILSAKVQLIESSTDIRDSTVYDLSAIVSSWQTNTLSLLGGINYTYQDSDGRIYDTDNIRLFINSDLSLTDHSTIYSTLTLFTGDITSSIPFDDSNNEVLDVIRQADDIEFDPAFGDNIIGYRINTRLAALTLGYNLVTGSRQSIDLSARYALGKSDHDVDYETLFINLSYLASFRL